MRWPVDAIIFDFDGVLIDSGGDIANAANYVLRSLGLVELPRETVVQYIGGGAERLLQKCLAERAGELFEQAYPLFKQRYSQYYLDETGLYPGVAQTLQHFYSAGKFLAIATQKIEKITWGILEGLQVAHYFQAVVGPESVAQRKPHPEALQRILKQAGVEPPRAVMVGDTEADIQAGKAAGTVTAGVTYGFGSRLEIHSAAPDIIMDRAEELVNHLY